MIATRSVRLGSRADIPMLAEHASDVPQKRTELLRCGGRQVRADFVAEVAEEIGVSRGDDYSNVGAALCGRSLQLERRL